MKADVLKSFPEIWSVHNRVWMCLCPRCWKSSRPDELSFADICPWCWNPATRSQPRDVQPQMWPVRAWTGKTWKPALKKCSSWKWTETPRIKVLALHSNYKYMYRLTIQLQAMMTWPCTSIHGILSAVIYTVWLYSNYFLIASTSPIIYSHSDFVHSIIDLWYVL